jgi:hypothetical protein
MHGHKRVLQKSYNLCILLGTAERHWGQPAGIMARALRIEYPAERKNEAVKCKDYRTPAVMGDPFKSIAPGFIWAVPRAPSSLLKYPL